MIVGLTRPVHGTATVDGRPTLRRAAPTRPESPAPCWTRRAGPRGDRLDAGPAARLCRGDQTVEQVDPEGAVGAGLIADAGGAEGPVRGLRVVMDTLALLRRHRGVTPTSRWRVERSCASAPPATGLRRTSGGVWRCSGDRWVRSTGRSAEPYDPKVSTRCPTREPATSDCELLSAGAAEVRGPLCMAPRRSPPATPTGSADRGRRRSRRCLPA